MLKNRYRFLSQENDRELESLIYEIIHISVSECQNCPLLNTEIFYLSFIKGQALRLQYCYS